ncbi:MAG: stage II sporulation protein M, partial [Candidatus Altiarchaeota archaeon]
FVFPAELSIVMVAISSLLVLPYVVKIFEFDELDVDIDTRDVGELRGWVVNCLRDGFSPQQIKNSLIRDNMDKPFQLLYDLTGVDEEYIKHMNASNVLSRHRKTIWFYIYLFFGMFLGYLFIWMVLDPASNAVAFKNQMNILSPQPIGSFLGGPTFNFIVINNLRIMLLCVLLSFFHGSGAIFILNYTASIAGVVYGSSFGKLVGIAGQPILYNPVAYIPHTTLEICAYLFAAIAGGILSKASLTAYRGMTRMLFKDGVILFLLALILLLVGAYVEVQVIT